MCSRAGPVISRRHSFRMKMLVQFVRALDTLPVLVSVFVQDFPFFCNLILLISRVGCSVYMLVI